MAPCKPENAFFHAEETGLGVTDVMWRLQKDVVIRTKAV